MDNKVLAEDRQSIFDIAVQELGNVELFFDIILKNNYTSVTEDITAKEVTIPKPPEIEDKRISKEVLKILNKRKIATL